MKYTSDQPREELVAALIRHQANQRYLIELAKIEYEFLYGTPGNQDAKPLGIFVKKEGK